MSAKRPQRRSQRLKHHDYTTPGGYFVTICTHRRLCILGSIAGMAFEPNPLGRVVSRTWDQLPDHYPNLKLDAFVVMPNHIHGLVFLTETRPRHSLTEIVRGFKTFTAKFINQHRGTPTTSVWQRGFHEHVVRNDEALDKIRQYILTNPARWALDRENPAFTRAGHRPAPTPNNEPAGVGFKPARKPNNETVGAGFKPARKPNNETVGAGFKPARESDR